MKFRGYYTIRGFLSALYGLRCVQSRPGHETKLLELYFYHDKGQDMLKATWDHVETGLDKPPKTC